MPTAADLIDALAVASDTRRVARRFVDLPPGELDSLLWSEDHAHRLAAVMVMAMQPLTVERVEGYLAAARAERIDSAELVDASAEPILGPWLLDRPRNLLFSLAKSDVVWERRIAIMATLHFLRAGDDTTTLEIAEKLVRERSEPIQQSVGLLLREVGKRVSEPHLLEFLERNAGRMPRTMLERATEHLGADARERYLL